MSRGKWAIVLVVVAVVALLGAAFAMELEGMPPVTWREKPLPPPSEVSVVVLPFWLTGTTGRTQAEMVRGAVLLNLQRHGLRLVPAGGSLAEIATATDQLVEAEWTGEPGVLRPDRELAIQVGRRAGADWVIYGDVQNLRTDDERYLLLLRRRVGTINMRLVFASVSTDETFWRQARDSWRTLPVRKGASIERKMAQDAVDLIFQHLATALPPHSVGPKVSQDDINHFVQAMGG